MPFWVICENKKTRVILPSGVGGGHSVGSPYPLTFQPTHKTLFNNELCVITIYKKMNINNLFGQNTAATTAANATTISATTLCPLSIGSSQGRGNHTHLDPNQPTISAAKTEGAKRKRGECGRISRRFSR